MKLFPKKSVDDVPRRRQQRAGDERRERASERAQEASTTFLRNRTLTGSLSVNVSSANELNGDLQSSRTQAHHLTHQRRKLTSALLGTIMVIIVLSALLFDLTVKPVVTSADHAVALDAGRYEQAIQKYLDERPIERLRVALDQTRLTEYLRQTVPEVETVVPDGSAGLGASEFRISMRRPIAGWIIGGKQYFVDEKGVPFDRNYYETPVVNVVDQSGVQQTTGTAIASSRFLTFVGRTVSESKSLTGLVVKEAIIPVGTTRQLQVKLEGRGYPIKLSLDRPVGEQIEDMKHAVEYFDSKKQTPVYVDIRVSGKAYYKEK